VKRVTGLGGIFFKAKDAEKLRAWYATHLGLPVEPWGGVSFHWRKDENPQVRGYTAWSVMKEDTRYFDPSRAPFMINYRVDDLDAVLEALRREGVPVDEKIDESEFGRFGWATDPEGNRFELWEPPKDEPPGSG
jgi:predicted enzyme related to lactoylglutathione lyase